MNPEAAAAVQAAMTGNVPGAKKPRAAKSVVAPPVDLARLYMENEERVAAQIREAEAPLRRERELEAYLASGGSKVAPSRSSGFKLGGESTFLDPSKQIEAEALEAAEAALSYGTPMFFGPRSTGKSVGPLFEKRRR